MLQLIASEVAAEAGYDPVCASTGAEALRFVEAHAADLAAVITDIKMPGDMNGLELAARIRDRWSELHVVVVSGSPFEVPAGCRLPGTGEAVCRSCKSARSLMSRDGNVRAARD